MKRLASKAARVPTFSKAGVTIPLSIKRSRDEQTATVKHNVVDFDNDLSWQKAWKKGQQIVKRRIRSQEPYLRLAVYPNDSISAKGIEGELKQLVRESWVPDVVAIDYADNLLPPEGEREHRHQVNRTWKQLRAISQTFHCLLITATQADAKGAEAWIITRRHFSEDKRQDAHVTAMFALNQTEEEKEEGITRLNWNERREEFFNPYRCVYVAGCLDIGAPAIKSCW
jgi:hypothetical protein